MAMARKAPMTASHPRIRILGSRLPPDLLEHPGLERKQNTRGVDLVPTQIVIGVVIAVYGSSIIPIMQLIASTCAHGSTTKASSGLRITGGPGGLTCWFIGPEVLSF
jgi:hypothetical protein